MSEDQQKTITENITLLLAENNMTQSELAEALQVSTASVSQWCNGRKIPRWDKIEAMCKVFGCTQSDITEKRLPDKVQRLVYELRRRPDLQTLLAIAVDKDPETILSLCNILKG